MYNDTQNTIHTTVHTHTLLYILTYPRINIIYFYIPST